MPVYDYECGACGKTTEVLLRTGDPKPRCPSCGSLKMKRGFSAPSIISKGGKGGSSSSKKVASSGSSCSRRSCSGCSGCG